MSVDNGSPARRGRTSALAAAGTALLFAALYAAFVGSTPGRGLDVEILTDAYYYAELRPMASAIVGISNAAVLTGAAGLLLALALLRHGRRVALTVAIMLAGGLGSPRILKAALEHADPVHGEAGRGLGAGFFPGGHASSTMALALAVVVLAGRHGHSAAAAALGGACAAVVGAAHVLELSHHPSDVLGGFVLAAAWASIAHALLGDRGALATRPGLRAAAPSLLSAGAVAVTALAILTVSDARPGLTLGVAGVALAAFVVAGVGAALVPARPALR